MYNVRQEHCIPCIFITCMSQGRIQVFIDAFDNDLGQLGQGDTIIAFGVDLELRLGQNFTERKTYLSQVWSHVRLSFSIDLSFKVQCSENYYGPSCDTFCEPVEGVSTCDNEGRIICIHSNISSTCTCMFALYIS